MVIKEKEIVPRLKKSCRSLFSFQVEPTRSPSRYILKGWVPLLDRKTRSKSHEEGDRADVYDLSMIELLVEKRKRAVFYKDVKRESRLQQQQQRGRADTLPVHGK